MTRMLGCTACGFEWDLPKGRLVECIDQFGTLWRSLVAQIRDERGPQSVLARPAPGVWSPWEYTAHMRDVIEFYLDRIERILSEDRPQLAAISFSELAETRRYNEQNIDQVLDTLDARASSAAAALRHLNPADWNRVGIGTDGDERDVLTLARRLAHEGHHHIRDIQPTGAA